MNIRRFVAATSRLALRDVREALGGDAVILANRAIEDGVEILAAASGDLSRMTEPLAPVPLKERAGPASLSKQPGKTATPAKPTLRERISGLPAKNEPDWLTEAQIVRTRQRIASLLDDTGAQDGDSDNQILQDLLAGHAEDAHTSLSAAARRTTTAQAPISQPPLASVAVAAAVAADVAADVAAGVAAAPFSAAPVSLAATAVPTVVSQLTASLTAPLVTPVVAAAAVTPSIAQQHSQPIAAAQSHPVSGAQPAAIADEMRSMRGFIEDQLATLAWRDGVSREPARMRILSDLIAAGLSPGLSRSVIDHLPLGIGYDKAREWISQILQRNLIHSTPQDDVIDAGGVFALVGPTGVGKTTTAAKLAARFAVKHGVNQLALITTDAYRIGAQDQLRIYGKILGIPVQTIHDQASLAASLSSVSLKKLVLIDTAGLSQRDDRVAEQIAMLRGVRAQRLLILNATTQTETLEETVRTYANSDCSGCVITKVDEAVRLGGILDVVLRNRLRLHYVSNGQRVPEDIHHPNPAYLVHRALRAEKPNRVFDVGPAEQPAWLAAVAQSAHTVRSTSHV